MDTSGILYNICKALLREDTRRTFFHDKSQQLRSQDGKNGFPVHTFRGIPSYE